MQAPGLRLLLLITDRTRSLVWMLRRRLKDAYAIACAIRIEDEALAVAGREGRNRMATATGLQDDLDRVVWAVVDHA